MVGAVYDKLEHASADGLGQRLAVHEEQLSGGVQGGAPHAHVLVPAEPRDDGRHVSAVLRQHTLVQIHCELQVVAEDAKSVVLRNPVGAGEHASDAAAEGRKR